MSNYGDKIAMELIKKNYVWLGLALIIIFVNVYSARTLTTKPAVWYDEGINIELARNFSEFGQLDLVVAPLTFSGRGPTIGSTGYTTTLPLALVFKIFGFGLEQARLYMLVWMTALVVCLFIFAQKTWGADTALLATFLVATFASFYGNGRSVMGEIPGFVFILLCLIWYLHKNNIFMAGIFLGLAIISKPSVFIFFIPAFVLLLLWQKRNFFSNLFKLGASSFLAFIVWIVIYSATALAPATWNVLGTHFSNPYEREGLNSIINIKNNLIAWPHSSTLVYFSLLALVVTVAAYFDRDFYKKNRPLFLLAGFYSLGAIFYFLKNITIFHYLAAVQLLIFILLAPSLKVLINRFFSRGYSRLLTIVCFSFLILFQFVYLFTGAKLFYSNAPQATFNYVQENYSPDEIVGLIDMPPVAALIPAHRRLQTISTYGLRDLGLNPLSLSAANLPGIIIFGADRKLEDKYATILDEHYTLDKTIEGKVMIYKKIR